MQILSMHGLLENESSLYSLVWLPEQHSMQHYSSSHALHLYCVCVFEFFLYYCINFYAYLGAADISKCLKNICIHK